MKTLRMLIMPFTVPLKIIEWTFRTSAKTVTGTAHLIQKGGNGIQAFLSRGSLAFLCLIILFLLSALVGAL